MKTFITSLIILLVWEIQSMNAQLIENDSIVTIEQNFNFSENNGQYFLSSNFQSKCYKKKQKFQYNYFRGTLQGQVPVQYYSKEHPKHEQAKYLISQLDTIITVYMIGSGTDKFYDLKISKKFPEIVIVFYNSMGKICDQKIFSKLAFNLLVMDNFLPARFPPYDTYSKVTLVKQFQ